MNPVEGRSMTRIPVSVGMGIVLALAATARAEAQDLSFQKFASAEGRFAVDLPGKAERNEETSGGMTFFKFSVPVPQSFLVFQVEYFDVPEGARTRNPHDVIKAWESGFRKGARFEAETEITLGPGKVPGREYRLVAEDGAWVRERVFMSSGRIYTIHVVSIRAKEPLDAPDANRFFDSFQITAGPEPGTAGAGALAFERVASAEGRFAAEFPGKPEVTEQASEGTAYFKYSTMIVERLAAFRVEYFDVPGNARNRDPQQIIRAFQSGARHGAQFDVDREIALDPGKVPGREYRLVAADGASVRERLFLAGGRLYIVQVASLRDKDLLDSGDSNRFLDSFQILSSLAPASSSKEALVSLSTVPSVVTDTVTRAAPEVKWLVAHRCAEEGRRTWFRLDGRDARGRFIKSIIDENGGVLAVVTEVPLAEVPKPALDALKTSFPDFVARKCAAYGKAAHAVDHYRVEGERPQDKNTLLLVRPDGSKVTQGR
jgi:hypothetical protein